MSLMSLLPCQRNAAAIESGSLFTFLFEMAIISILLIFLSLITCSISILYYITPFPLFECQLSPPVSLSAHLHNSHLIFKAPLHRHALSVSRIKLPA